LAVKKVRELGNDIRLVFVGGDDYFYGRLKQFVADQKIDGIVFSGFVPDGEMGVVLENAFAYVRPSLYEGFELPPLEAMTQGVPVISSSHECALEILGDSALYFDGNNSDDIAAKIMQLQNDPQLQKMLIEKGYEQIKIYDWTKMARQTLEIYQS